MYNKLVNKEAKLALVGLGYVGLPLLWNLQRRFQ